MEPIGMCRIQVRTLFVLFLTVFGVTSLAFCQEKLDPETKSAAESAQADTEEEGSPEAVLRQFLIAMTSGDADSIEELTLPNDDIKILLTGEKPPKPAVEQMTKFFATIRISRLKVGEKFKLPGGKTITFDESKIHEKRQLLSVPSAPIPFVLVKTDEDWKVDPAPMIAARKAAKAAMEKKPAKEATGK